MGSAHLSTFASAAEDMKQANDALHAALVVDLCGIHSPVSSRKKICIKLHSNTHPVARVQEWCRPCGTTTRLVDHKLCAQQCGPELHRATCGAHAARSHLVSQ